MHSFLKTVKALSQLPMAYLLLLFALPCAASSQTRIVNATIDASKTGAPISKNIYGQFLEHGGDIVNTGVWSEMLVDRKFFYLVAATAPTPPPVTGNAAGNPRFRRTPTRWWVPIGGDHVVTMDIKAPYTGDESPLVKLDAKEPHGFRQSGIAIRKGNAYTARIVLAGSPGTVVDATLIWGKEAADRQTVTIRALGTAFRKFPLRYTPAVDTDDATLEITGTGTGFFRVGTVSLMPADNIEGFRPEVIAAKLWRMAPGSIDATVQVDKKPEVQIEEQSLGPLPDTITVRPFSVNIYSYPVQ
jgi:alpha-N-arabinofuranosidase